MSIQQKIEAAAFRVSHRVTAGHFNDLPGLMKSAKEMISHFQSGLNGLPALAVLRKASDAAEQASSDLESAESLQEKEACYLAASKALHAVVAAPKKNISANKAEVQALLDFAKKYKNVWHDDEFLFLFAAPDILNILVVARMMANGNLAAASDFHSSLDTDLREEFPDAVYKMLQGEDTD